MPATVNAVNFDGTNDYLTRGGQLTGAVDGKEATLSVWIKRGADGTAQYIKAAEHATFGIYPTLEILLSNLLKINLFTPAAGWAWGTTTTSTIVAADGWTHILFSVDTATGVRAMYIDDVLETLTESGFVADALIDWTFADEAIGAYTSGGTKFNGDMAEFWMDDGFIDLSVVANRRKFITSSLKPVELGSDGSTPTGNSPLIYLSGATDSWHTNKGTGGGFTETGALTDATTSPSD